MKPIEPGCMALVISAPKHSVQLVGSEVKVISIASIEWQRRGLGRAWIVDSDLVRQCCAQLTSECIVCYPVFLESRLLRIDGYEGRIDIEHTSRFAPSISLDRISECLEKSLRETVEQIERAIRKSQ